MTLSRLLSDTGDGRVILRGGAIQVFPAASRPDPRYWRLDDYVVSSAVSGPSLVLIPR